MRRPTEDHKHRAVNLRPDREDENTENILDPLHSIVAHKASCAGGIRASRERRRPNSDRLLSSTPGPTKWQNSKRDGPQLSLALSRPKPNGLGRSIGHAQSLTSAFPACELHVKAHANGVLQSTTAAQAVDPVPIAVISIPSRVGSLCHRRRTPLVGHSHILLRF